ncbi:hypothetical protein RNZ50_03460 [Paracoccaceae bacterium Fryx2]|nr:hypothetical protein [Paracoccaceae bacterium Fryx2]
MRRFLLFALVVVPLLAACQLALPGGGGTPPPLTAEPIEVTSLDAPGQAIPQPKARPAAAPAAPATAPQPDPAASPPAGAAAPDKTAADPPPEAAAPKSPVQLACERTGGRFAVSGGGGAKTCIRPTRDGGKSCSRQGDCEGVCLARSRTCAPIAPLFGCNEILQADGQRVTLCID